MAKPAKQQQTMKQRGQTCIACPTREASQKELPGRAEPTKYRVACSCMQGMERGVGLHCQCVDLRSQGPEQSVRGQAKGSPSSSLAKSRVLRLLEPPFPSKVEDQHRTQGWVHAALLCRAYETLSTQSLHHTCPPAEDSLSKARSGSLVSQKWLAARTPAHCGHMQQERFRWAC